MTNTSGTTPLLGFCVAVHGDTWGMSNLEPPQSIFPIAPTGHRWLDFTCSSFTPAKPILEPQGATGIGSRLKIVIYRVVSVWSLNSSQTKGECGQVQQGLVLCGAKVIKKSLFAEITCLWKSRWWGNTLAESPGFPMDFRPKWLYHSGACLEYPKPPVQASINMKPAQFPKTCRFQTLLPSKTNPIFIFFLFFNNPEETESDWMVDQITSFKYVCVCIYIYTYIYIYTCVIHRLTFW